MTYDGADADDDGVVEANVDNGSVSTDEQSLKSDNDNLAMAVINDNDQGIKREIHPSIQDAVDAVPENEGYVWLMSTGDKSDGAGYEVSQTINTSNMGESLFWGTGAGCRVFGSISDPILFNTSEDTEIAHLMISNTGSGDAIVLDQNTHVYDLHVDDAGNNAIADIIPNDWSLIGPYVEIKQGPKAAISTQGYSTIADNHIVKLSGNGQIGRGIEITGGLVLTDSNQILLDGNSGDDFGVLVEAGGGEVVLNGDHVGASPQTTGSTGPTVGYSLRSGNVTATGLSEDGTCSEGVRIAGDVDNVNISGSFPSGVYFDSDVTTPGGVIIDGEIGGINEATAGNAAGQVINGRSYVDATPGEGSIWDGNAVKAHRLGVEIEDRSVAAPYPIYVADSDGNWAIQADDVGQGAQGVANSTQAISSGTNNIVELDAVGYEDDATTLVEVDTANDRLTAQRSGRYRIAGGIHFKENFGDGNRLKVDMLVNNTSVAIDDSTVGGLVQPATTLTKTVELNSGDDVQLRVLHDVGSSKNLFEDETVFLEATYLGR